MIRNYRSTKYAFILSLFFLIFINYLFGENIKILDIKDNNKTIYLNAGDYFDILLESNPSTGYNWYPMPFDEKIINLLSQGMLYDEPESSDESKANHNFIIAGRGGICKLSFRAFSNGEVDLSIVYKRIWEVDQEPLRKYNIKIIIVNKFT